MSTKLGKTDTKQRQRGKTVGGLKSWLTEKCHISLQQFKRPNFTEICGEAEVKQCGSTCQRRKGKHRKQKKNEGGVKGKNEEELGSGSLVEENLFL